MSQQALHPARRRSRKQAPKHGRARRPRRWRRTLVIAAICLLGPVIALLIAAAAHAPFNVLVVGVDGDGSAGHRSDTILLVSAEPRLGKLSLVSIPRDTLVNIPDYGPDKAGHAFAYGGADLTRASVSGLLGVTIQRTAVVSLDGFVQLVDALGGVEIDVEQAMYYHDPYQDLLIDLEPGLQRLDGEQAMQYVRYRSDGSDLTRVARQHRFLQAVVAEARRPDSIRRWPMLAQAGLAMIDTDLNVFDLAALLLTGLRAGPDGIASATVPGTSGTGSNGLWYWFPDETALPALADDVLYSR